MKVLSYNTLFGGCDGADRSRYGVQLDLIKSVAPDVLMLQEARGFAQDGHALLFSTEQQIGMRGFLGIAPRTGQHVAIFLRAPISVVSLSSDSDHFHHAKLAIVALVPGFADPVTLICVHLCPNAAHVRRTEAAYLLNDADPGKLSIVGGDFNTIAPWDGNPTDLCELPAHHRLRYTDEGGANADGTPLQFLRAAGWIDIGFQEGAGGQATVPTRGFSGTEFATFRSDYFLASARLASAVSSYQVIRNDSTDFASDHYPICAEFALGGTV